MMATAMTAADNKHAPGAGRVLSGPMADVTQPHPPFHEGSVLSLFYR